jgi:Heterokaryon incompatibility protein (HET)
MSPSGKAPAQALEYQYDPLPDSQFIRMLTLYPGAPGDPLKGELKPFNIASREEYESLSYVWGEKERRYEIICDGKHLGLTSSLHSALRQLRWPDRPRRLWADQICINQKNKAERSQQIQFMNHIYKNASHVLVWLGSDDQGIAEPAFKKVRELDEIFQDEEECEKFRIEHTDNLEKRSRDPWVPLTHITHLP